MSVDLVRRIVKVGEKDVKLSPKEYELLRVLVQHAGKVLTHKFLLGELWDDLTDAQYLRVYVRQLRQKIEADPERPQYVLTETGIGYRLRVIRPRGRSGSEQPRTSKTFSRPTTQWLTFAHLTKARLLQELAAQAATALKVAADRISIELLKREELGSTGTGGGVERYPTRACQR